MMSTPLGRTLCAASMLLCAGCTTVQVAGPTALRCSDFTPEELTKPTPHAPPPPNARSDSWVNFGIAEAGQVNIANRDREIERGICRKIEMANDAARKAAEKKASKHIWEFWK